MNDFNLRIEKVTGKSEPGKVCYIFSNRVSLADSSVGTMVACILAEGDEVGADIGKTISEIFIKKLESADGGYLEHLENALEDVKRFAGESSIDISLVNAFFLENVCYITKFSGGVKIFAFDPPKSMEIDFEAGSGPIMPGQIYVIATDAFLKTFDTSVFEKPAEVDFEEIIDGIATEIATEENQSEIGAVFVQVAEGTKNTIRQKADRQPAEAKVEEEKEEIQDIESSEEKSEEDEGKEKQDEFSEDKKRGGVFNSIRGQISRIRHGDVGLLRKNLVFVAVVVVLILAGSVGFALREKNQKENLAKFSENLNLASNKYGEAIAIMDLNKARARELLIEADKAVKIALEVKSEDETAHNLLSDISKKLSETEGGPSVEFREVGKFEEDIVGLGFIGSNLMGISKGKLYEVNLNTQNVDGVDGKSDAKSGFVFDSRAYVVGGDKVSRLDFVSGAEVNIGDYNGVLDIWVFAGNVYLLSEDKITKIVPIESGYADGVDYLFENQQFSGTSRFAIDGSIWVTSGDKIFKFTRGNREDFEISGVTSSIGELSQIFTNANLNNLYVVDVKNSALLVVSKEDGSLVKVYQGADFAKAADVLVNDDETKVYLAVGSKILEANLE